MTSKWLQASKEDPDRVRDIMPMPVQKATVVRAPDHPGEEGYHQVYVELHVDDSRERAIVLTPKVGDVSVPKEGENVMVLFGAADKPVVLGSWYPVDDERGEPLAEQVPDYEAGDRVIGNENGYIAVRKDGTVETSDEKGYHESHLTNTQTSVEGGTYVNIFQNGVLSSGFTYNSASSIQPDKGGTYRIDFTVNFHRTGTSGRNVMYAEVEIGGTRLTERSRSVCYLRNDIDGDEGDATGTVIADIAAGENIRVYAGEERGGETGNDIERANISIEHIA